MSTPVIRDLNGDLNAALFAFIERYMPLTGVEKAALAKLDVFRSYRKGAVVIAAGRTVSSEVITDRDHLLDESSSISVFSRDPATIFDRINASHSSGIS